MIFISMLLQCKIDKYHFNCAQHSVTCQNQNQATMTVLRGNKGSIHEENMNVLLDNCALWISEINLLENEILFLKKVLKSHPFESNIPNLFEKLTLFMRDFDMILDEKDDLLVAIEKHNSSLKKAKQNNGGDTLKLLLTHHTALQEQVITFFSRFSKCKENLYEFTLSIIN